MLTPQKIQDEYIDNNYIRKCKLNSKEDLFSLLKWWLKLSSENTIGDLSKVHRQTRIINLILGSNHYYLNADTTRDGVKEFLLNKQNSWSIIVNQNGEKNLVTNSDTNNSIQGLYFYKIIN